MDGEVISPSVEHGTVVLFNNRVVKLSSEYLYISIHSPELFSVLVHKAYFCSKPKAIQRLLSGQNAENRKY